MGAKKYDLLEQIPTVENGCILEIGEGAGEGSSEYLQNLAYSRGMKFISVDIHPTPKSNIDPSNYYSMTGEKFLEEIFPSLGLNIAGAYLDNFDWAWCTHGEYQTQEWVKQQNNWYAERKISFNNLNSSLAHLRQTILLQKYCVDGTLVLFDDTWVDTEKDVLCGKGNAAIYYMLGTNKWELVDPLPNSVLDSITRINIEEYCQGQIHFLLRHKS